MTAGDWAGFAIVFVGGLVIMAMTARTSRRLDREVAALRED